MKKEILNKYSSTKKLLCYVLMLLIVVPFNFIFANSVDAYYDEGGGAISPSFYVHTESVGAITGDSVVVTWHTNKPSDGRIVYGLSPVENLGTWPNLGYSNTTTPGAGHSTFHSVKIEKLNLNTKYYFRVVSSGAFGKELSFATIKNETKESEEVLINIAKEVTAKELICVDMDGDGYFNKASDADCGDIDCDDNDSSKQECKEVVATNNYNSSHPLFYTHNERIKIDNDKTSITWHTNKPSTSRIVYGLSPVKRLGPWPNLGYANSTAKDLDKKTFHQVSVENLKPGSTYYFRVISGASPEVFSDELSITTDNLDIIKNGDSDSGSDEVKKSPENKKKDTNIGSLGKSDISKDSKSVTTNDDVVSGSNNTYIASTVNVGSSVDVNVDDVDVVDNVDTGDDPGTEDAICGLDSCDDENTGMDNTADDSGSGKSLIDWMWFIFLVLLVGVYYFYEKYWAKNIDDSNQPVDSGMVDKLSRDKNNNKNFKQNYKELKDDDK